MPEPREGPWEPDKDIWDPPPFSHHKPRWGGSGSPTGVGVEHRDGQSRKSGQRGESREGCPGSLGARKGDPEDWRPIGLGESVKAAGALGIPSVGAPVAYPLGWARAP